MATTEVKLLRNVSAAGENFGFLTSQKPVNDHRRSKIIKTFSAAGEIFYKITPKIDQKWLKNGPFLCQSHDILKTICRKVHNNVVYTTFHKV